MGSTNVLTKKMERSYSKLKNLNEVPPILYRGINSKYANFNEVFSDKAYMSCSTNLDVAITFGDYILVLSFKPNSPNIKDIRKYNFLNEEEFLINKNTTFKVLKRNGNFIYLMEI